MFYSIPLIISYENILFFKLKLNNKYLVKSVLLSFIVTIFLIYNFNYSNEMYGGGIFYKFSNIFFKNNIPLFIISFFSIFFLLLIFMKKNWNDILLIVILICLDPDPFIYHKTYDPLILCIFLLLFKNKLFSNLTKNTEKKITTNLTIFYYSVFFIYFIIRLNPNF